MRTRIPIPISRALCGGFTLVELIIVIVITGIIAGMIAVFIRSPIEAYVDTARRAQLTESADTALRRISRDLHAALPNSVRVTAVGTTTYLQFIPTVGGGRYRQYPTGTSTGNVLDFNSPDGAFDVIGPVPVYAKGDSVVVFNLGQLTENDAYEGKNRAVATSLNGSADLFSSDAIPHTVTLATLIQFPAPSPSARFHVVTNPVSYVCSPNAANPALGTVLRFPGNAFTKAQPMPPAGVGQVLVAGVAECNITYDAAATTTRTGLVTLMLRLESGGESVRLVQQFHVQNAP